MMRRIMFGSCYVYSPAGANAASALSRLLRALLKEGDARLLDKCALRVRQQVHDRSPLAAFFGPDQVLVPIPGCARTTDGAVSVTVRLSSALQEAHLGQRVWPGLHRVRSVPKSATALPGSRPTLRTHYDSFGIDESALQPPKFVLIDDVVTKGRTLLAAASRLHDVFPHAEIRAFALLRTMGLEPCVDHLLEPCIGEIRWQAGDAYRSP
jgi:hypothetical protein